VNTDLIPYLFVMLVGEDGIYDNTVVQKYARQVSANYCEFVAIE
jgi:hypothetical protein